MTSDPVDVSISIHTDDGVIQTHAGLLSDFDGILSQAKLKIVILGPDPNAGDLYKKRCDIRDKLISLGHIAHFCEDICKPEILKGLNLSVAEFIILNQYDYIICMMCSFGTVGEVHDFGKNPSIARKMMICADRQHRSGYSAKSVINIFEGYNGKMDWYEYPTDIRDCHLMARVIDQIEKVAERKQWEIINGGVPI